MTHGPTISELSDRAREVFRQVVESYLDSGIPVGSRTLAQLPGGLGLSPASIRSVLHELEGIGLLGSPHTSAGRIPTDIGLRLFVDGIMQASEAAPEEQAAIAGLAVPDRAVETVLERATSLLSGLSSCAAVVMVPKADRVLRQASFTQLTPTRVLAILVADDGTVENRVLDLPGPISPAALVEAGNFLTARLAGGTLSAAAERLQREIDADRALVDATTRDLVARGIASWAADGSDRDVLIYFVDAGIDRPELDQFGTECCDEPSIRSAAAGIGPTGDATVGEQRLAHRVEQASGGGEKGCAA